MSQSTNQPSSESRIPAKGPLDGLNVLDLSAIVSGPLTATLLGDMGAKVTKVERVGSGDIQRHVGSKRNGFSGFFHMLNRGKQSIALDFSKQKAIEIVHKLVVSADIVVQNFRPGVADRLGIGYKQLSAINDQIIYLSISGFGQTGPQANTRAYDPIIQTYSGIAAAQGLKRGEGPEQVNQLIVDKLTAYTGSQAILAALYSRSQSQKGQHIELSMLDTTAAFLWPDAGADMILQGDNIEHIPPIGGSGQLTQYKDGWGATLMLSDAEFQGLCRAYELSGLAADERFNTIANRMTHQREFVELLHYQVAQAASKLTVDEAEKRLLDNHVPFAKLRYLHELPDDPQMINNKVFREINHPIAGHLRETRPAPLFSDTPATAGGPAPDVGQHTKEILASVNLLENLEELIAEGVVSI